MARQIRSRQVTVPAGTTKAAPATFNVSFPPMTVAEIDVLVPPGSNGTLGFQIASSGIQVIPWNAGEWIVTNNERLAWPTEGYPDSGDWQVIAYNTGMYDHSLWVRFSLSPVAVAVAGPVVVDLGALSSPAAGLTTGEGGGVSQPGAGVGAPTGGQAGAAGAGSVLAPAGGVGSGAGFEVGQ